ncbi:hypothetical protein [Nocardia sp. SC052]|uniref:hypothetical protein n=1 Tax=Nocardia sichangensis TaxID=3385975 RepID=UPI0039A2BFB2
MGIPIAVLPFEFTLETRCWDGFADLATVKSTNPVINAVTYAAGTSLRQGLPAESERLPLFAAESLSGLVSRLHRGDDVLAISLRDVMRRVSATTSAVTIDDVNYPGIEASAHGCTMRAAQPADGCFVAVGAAEGQLLPQLAWVYPRFDRK